jgi:hypothetical protein
MQEPKFVPKISQEAFEKEIGMCRELFREKGGCNWGMCENCGVVPLLYKLAKGELHDSPEAVADLKKRVFEEGI